MSDAAETADRVELPPGVSVVQQAMRREIVLLGNVLVGEISPSHGGRFAWCFRLFLPGSSATNWRPASDEPAALRSLLQHLNDWLNAADVCPNAARGSSQ